MDSDLVNLAKSRGIFFIPFFKQFWEVSQVKIQLAWVCVCVCVRV